MLVLGQGGITGPCESGSPDSFVLIPSQFPLNSGLLTEFTPHAMAIKDKEQACVHVGAHACVRGDQRTVLQPSIALCSIL